MKKIIFLLLLAQTIAFLYGDAGCLGSSPAHSYQGYNENPGDEWGMEIARTTKHTNCLCNCAKYPRAGNKCQNCGHINLPVAFNISDTKNVVHKKEIKKSKTRKEKTKKEETKKKKKASKKNKNSQKD